MAARRETLGEESFARADLLQGMGSASLSKHIYRKITITEKPLELKQPRKNEDRALSLYFKRSSWDLGFYNTGDIINKQTSGLA